MSKIHDLISADQAAANAKVSNVPAPDGEATGDLPPDQSPSAQLGITGVLRDTEPITDIIDPDPITTPEMPTTLDVPTDPPILRDL